MPINQTSPLRPTHDEIMNKMSLNQTSPLVPIKPNGFLKNVSNRSSFCGVPHSPAGDGTLLKTFAVNRKSWSGNGTLPLQQYSYLERELPHTAAPELGTFKTGTFPRRRNAGTLPLTPNGNEVRRSGAPGPGRRYAEIGNWAKRSSTFLEPHLQGVGVKSQRGRLAAAGSSDSDSGADEERALLRRGSPRSLARRRVPLAGRSTPLRDESYSRVCPELDSRGGPESDSRGCPEAASAGVEDTFPVPAPRTHIYRPPEPEESAGDSVSQSRASSSCSGSSRSSSSGPRAPCTVGLLERLLRTHPVWFLPGIQRAGAFHLLQGKEEGNFVVRQSSQSDTMAISVRLPADKGPYIEHYLIQAGAGRIGLETSQNKFNNIPELIAHYSQCCDELPVQLTLPRALCEAKNRQQLSSLALLGQEFWRYPMANPRSGQQPPSPVGALPMAVTPSDTGSSVGSFNTGAQDNNNIIPQDNMNSDQNIVLNLAPIENSGSPPHTGQNSLSTFKACSQPPSNLNHPNGNMVRAPRPTPPNTLNLISSTAHLTQPTLFIPPPDSSPPHHLSNGNLKSTPPPPPPRWAKPPFTPSTGPLASPTSCSSEIKMFSALNKVSQASGNITVTTTVTFSVNNTQIHNHQINENMSDDQLQLTLASNSINNNLVDPGVVNGAIKFHCSAASGAQSLSRRLSPEGECISSIAATLHGSFKRQFAQGDANPSQVDTNSNMSQSQTNPPASPETVGNTFTKSASTSFVHSNQMTSPNGSISVTSGIFSPTSQINSPMSNGTISSKSGIFSPVSQLTNKSEVFSPLSRSSPLSGKSVFSPVSNQSSFNSPLMGKDREKVLSLNTNTSSTTPSGRSRRSKHSLRKESRHYQESDILESPGVYYRSSLMDKVSDYEDIWGPDHGNTNCSTFKPIKQETENQNSGLLMSKRPDLLPDTLPKLTNAKSTLSVMESDKLQSFTASTDSLNNKIPNPQAAKPPVLYHEPPNEIIATTNSKGEIVPKRPDKLSIARNVNKLLSEEIELERSDAAVESQVTSDTDISHIVKSDESLLSDVGEPQKEGPGSPFYSDPVDAIKEAAALPLVQRRKLLRVGVGMAQRYSEPPNNNHPYYPLRDMHSIEELSPSSPNTSSSVDNLIALRTNRPKVKPVQPPRIMKPPNSRHDQTWAVDSSWEFIGKNEEGGASSESGTFPSLAEQESRLSGVDDSRHQLTVHHVLAQRFPDLRLSPAPRALEDGRTGTSAQEAAAAEEARAARTSCYDNVNESKRGASSQASDDGTVFSEPWDTSRWDGLLPPAHDSSAAYDAEDDDSGTMKEDSSYSLPEPCQRRHQAPHLATVTRAKSFRDRLDPLLAPPRLQALRGHRGAGAPGAALRAYALHLSADKSTTFAQNVDNFIACTLDSKEIRPQIVMRNMRQFMSGMKNYLVKHGEREFEKEVEKERLKLKQNEFLNLDAILEGVMHRLVVRPLRSRLYALLADWHAADVRSLAESINLARDKTPLEIGIRPSTIVPSSSALAVISKHFLKMQEADSPLDKLESLLAAISAIFNSIRSECAVGADDLLPVLVWVLVRCSLVCAELEAELMAGLLPPALLAGEGGYYLTTLFSAVAVLKKLKADSVSGDTSLNWRNQSLGSCASSNNTTCSAAVLRVALPDECRGSIRRVALPYRPGARAKELCRALAHAAAITNPQDYALFALINGQETILGENDCPQEFMSEKSGKNCILAYKRIDAKIAWPQQALLSLP